jgi:hypothetical protein
MGRSPRIDARARELPWGRRRDVPRRIGPSWCLVPHGATDRQAVPTDDHRVATPDVVLRFDPTAIQTGHLTGICAIAGTS